MELIKGAMRALQQWTGRMKQSMGTPIATPETDPNYFGALAMMPNPDPILREMGCADQVYRAMLSDPHILGEIRSIYGSFRQYKHRINVGAADDSQAKAAADLVADWMAKNPPNNINDWLEVMWQMGSAALTGYTPHEAIWGKSGAYLLPSSVVDRPGRRFGFDTDGQPLLISRGAWQGEAVDPYRFIISRHMPSVTNPYGIALLSACFWAWTFKTGGWRFFVKYCERHGLPWPVARYPLGTGDKDLDELEEALRNMIENAYAVVPDGTGLELLVPKGSGGDLPQESLINLCNREMSKALTGHAMIAELQGAGARAASETAMKRQDKMDETVRDIAIGSMNKLFSWITLVNFGADVPAPTLEFFTESSASKERAETYEIAARLGAKPSRKALLAELNIPEQLDDDDALVLSAASPVLAVSKPAKPEDKGSYARLGGGLKFARELGMDESELVSLSAQDANQWIDDTMFQPAMAMLASYEAQGKSLADFEADLGQLLETSDADTLRGLTEQAIKLSYLKGQVAAMEGTE